MHNPEFALSERSLPTAELTSDVIFKALQESDLERLNVESPDAPLTPPLDSESGLRESFDPLQHAIPPPPIKTKVSANEPEIQASAPITSLTIDMQPTPHRPPLSLRGVSTQETNTEEINTRDLETKGSPRQRAVTPKASLKSQWALWLFVMFIVGILMGIAIRYWRIL